MAASPGFFGVFFSGHFQIHGNLEIRFSCGVYCGGLQRRIQVHRRCRPDEPARVVKPHRKHAHNTTGEVDAEFQPPCNWRISTFENGTTQAHYARFILHEATPASSAESRPDHNYGRFACSQRGRAWYFALSASAREEFSTQTQGRQAEGRRLLCECMMVFWAPR